MAKVKIGKFEIDEKELDKQHKEAVKRGRERMENELRAQSVRYDKRKKRIIIELTNGCSFMFPPKLAQRLSDASDSELSDCHVLGVGFAVEWSGIDAQFSVTGLMQGVFGNKAWMEKLKRNGVSNKRPSRMNKLKSEKVREPNRAA
jgi:hypothetical protein